MINLAKNEGDQKITLPRTDPDDADLAHIAITWGTDGSATVEPQTETYTGDSLTNGTEYTYTLKTADTSGTGQTIQATPTAPAPTAQNGEITGTSAEIVLHVGCDASWQPTGGEWTAAGGTPYDLYIYTTEDADGYQTDKQDTFPRQITATAQPPRIPPESPESFPSPAPAQKAFRRTRRWS